MLIYQSHNAFTDEKNEKSKLLIKSKISEYMARAETLKKHLNAQQESKGRSAVGVNGGSGGVGGAGAKKCIHP